MGKLRPEGFVADRVATAGSGGGGVYTVALPPEPRRFPGAHGVRKAAELP